MKANCRERLAELDREAQDCGADKVRSMIADVLEDLDHPAGLDLARLAMHDIYEALAAAKGPETPRPLTGRSSQASFTLESDNV